MLPKKSRLKKEKDFKKLLSKAKSAKESFLILKYLQNNDERVRVGISVSKKVSKKATERNKQKRRLAALVKEVFPEIKKGIDVFLIALPGLEKNSFAQTREICQKIFKKAKILTNEEGAAPGN